MVVFDSEPIDFVCLCMSCSHGLAVGRSVVKDKIMYHGYPCRLKGSLSAYVFKVEKCCNYEEYDSTETFVEYVKKHPKHENPSEKVTLVRATLPKDRNL